MAHPLDGTAFHGYARRLGFRQDTQDLLVTVRRSPPNRTPGNRHGNVCVWYPSKKMQCIIKAESHKVEFAFLLEAEHDDEVLEFWDQPPAIPLEYRDAHGHWQRPWHTADYFVFRYDSAGWLECKPTQELLRQARTRPNRYVRDAHGVWQCPPGVAFAAQYGLTYRVRASEEINWVAQGNWQFLEDYYQERERLTVTEADLAMLSRIVDEQPGITLADLRLAAVGVTTDAINVAIAVHALYMDLATYRLSEPGHAPVYRTRDIAKAITHGGSFAADHAVGAHPVEVRAGSHIWWNGQHGQIVNVGQQDITLVYDGGEIVSLGSAAFTQLVTTGRIVGGQQEIRSRISPAGQVALAHADDADLATAIFRNRVINPDQYQDDEQARSAAQRAAVPARTLFRWKRHYREAELRDGSGLIGLLPHYHHCGGRQRLAPAVRALIEEVLSTQYDTATRAPKRGAYGEYLKQSTERTLAPASQRTFYTEAQRYKTRYDRTVLREGTRAAYPYLHEPEATIPRHGVYAWSMAHLDHTELDLALCDSQTGHLLGKCWLTLLILSQPRRIAAYCLTFDPPSYRSCLLVLRLCVLRYGRLPTAITVDGGAEFQSVYFEHLLALYRVRKHQRPAAEPRFGSVQERLFGTMATEFIQHLLGNTQALRQPRVVTRATDPRRQAVWTLPAVAERTRQWADEEYDTIRHPALGMSPREAYALSIERDGARAHKLIPYDDAFLMATLPTTRKGTALVQPGVGVRMQYLDYWCEAMRDPAVERTLVKVRYDPFDVSIGYAYLDGRWRRCVTPYNEFAGCSERELQLLAEEVRQRQRLLHGREQIELTQKQLAAFRRENGAVEVVLRQQRHDREARAALIVLAGGGTPTLAADGRPLASVSGTPRQDEPGSSTAARQMSCEQHEQLLVFRRIRL